MVGIQEHISREVGGAVGAQFLFSLSFGFEVYVLIRRFAFCVLLLKKILSPKSLLLNCRVWPVLSFSHNSHLHDLDTIFSLN